MEGTPLSGDDGRQEKRSRTEASAANPGRGRFASVPLRHPSLLATKPLNL